MQFGVFSDCLMPVGVFLEGSVCLVCKGGKVECCSEGRMGCDDCVAGCRE